MKIVLEMVQKGRFLLQKRSPHKQADGVIAGLAASGVSVETL